MGGWGGEAGREGVIDNEIEKFHCRVICVMMKKAAPIWVLLSPKEITSKHRPQLRTGGGLELQAGEQHMQRQRAMELKPGL